MKRVLFALFAFFVCGLALAQNCSVTLGYGGATTVYAASKTVQLVKFSCSNQLVNTFRAYIDEDQSAVTVVWGIYSDNSGAPASILYGTSLVDTSASNSWKNVSKRTPFTFTLNGTYWISYQASNYEYSYNASGSPTNAWFNWNFVDAWNPFVTVYQTGSEVYSVCADYCP